MAKAKEYVYLTESAAWFVASDIGERLVRWESPAKTDPGYPIAERYDMSDERLTLA
ncbi:hypothetical protein [Nocardia sp. NPDC057668]|uniref:hypothetical protein n=1 Tax=Nocardia sp. NPDC057668 TaxID=3346202 RepID=UPI003670891D